MASILNIAASRARFEQYAQPVMARFAEGGIDTGGQVTPPQLVDAIRQLLVLLQKDPGSWDPSLPEDEPERIGDLCIGLLMDLATWADRLGEREARAALETVTVSIAAWLVQHQQPIHILEPVVNGLALLANAEHEPAALQALASIMEGVVEAASDDYASDLESTDPKRPWRILLFNWGITATRAHDPEGMRKAFSRLRECLPADAAVFFREGRQQVLQGNYPADVRQVMLEAAESNGHGLH